MSINMVNNGGYGNYGYYQNRYNQTNMNYYDYPEIDMIEKPVKKDGSSTGTIVAGIGATIGALYMVKKGKGKAFFESIKKAFGNIKSGISKFSSKGVKVPPKKSPASIIPTKITPATQSSEIEKITKPAVQKVAQPTVEQKITSKAAVKPTVPDKIAPKATSATTAKEIVKTTKSEAQQTVATDIKAKTATTTTPVKANAGVAANATFESAKAEFGKIPESSLCKGSKGFIAELKPHSYGADKSMVSVQSIGRQGYENASINTAGKTFPKIATPKCDSGQRAIIGSLPDGRKYVSLGVAPGRRDFAGRNFQSTIKIVSDGKDFTPLQRDLIDVISAKAKTPFSYNESDILSLAMYNNGGSYYSLGFNKDIFLSSVATARQQLAGQIDATFVKKALKLPAGANLSL